MGDFFILWCKLLLGSVVFVGLFIYSLKSLENDNNSNSFSKHLTIEEIKEDYSSDYNILFLSCIQELKEKQICHQEILDKYNFLDDKNTVVHTNNVLIYIIYILLAIVLNSQVTLYFYTRNSLDKLDKLYFYLSDWSINSAPILGVLGTIMAFALLVSNSQTENIAELFGKYFFDAAITTLLGGFIYIFNLWLNIYIQPKIKE